ncbi:MAG TPA: PilZ domain-containing protein [Dissulfurispiraceae bacterium]|nr:PilZ domain-containing protein [Dissulfurispiraceae bacterium]
MNNQMASIEVLSEGRRYQRFVKEGAVALIFGERSATGNLVNLSVSGLLANFRSSDPLPGMSDRVDMRLEAGGLDNMLELNGTVVRVQVSRDLDKQDMIELAIDFGDLSPAAKHGLQQLINYLLLKAARYK